MVRIPDPATLAIDFGTSNSAAAVPGPQGGVRRLVLESANETLPTAVFFPDDGGPMRIGADAQTALIAGDEGRYMRALKSVLGTALFHDERLIAGRRRTLAGIITGFLSEVRRRAEALTGQRFHHAVSGRPVHFHSADPDRDARAAEDLGGCYRAAGFDSVRFVLEPEAAALANRDLGRADGPGLIVDIGGGTSDFTVFRRQGRSGIDVLASHGIRLGGTDFDQAISLRHVMPLLGQGGQLRRDFGNGLLPMPNRYFVDLATWARIPFLYTPETRRALAGMLRQAVDPARLGRIETVIRDELGHDIAFAVESGKIAVNDGAAAASIALGMVEPGLSAPLTGDGLTATLAEQSARLRKAMEETLATAGVAPGKIGAVILVGGSSLMGLVERAAGDLCPAAEQLRAEAFTAVVDGLALAIGQHG